MENPRSPSPKSVENIEQLRQLQEKMVAESLNNAFNSHRKLLDQIFEEKTTVSKQLLESQSENHSLRLQNEKLLHVQQNQARLLESKEALIAQLQEQDRKNMATLSEKETTVKRLLFEKGDAETKLVSERQSHQKQMEKAIKEAEQKLQQECAKLREHLQTEHRAELDNKEREWQGKFKMLTESLEEAAAAHRKLESERDKFFSEKKEMEENLDKYKRRFVAELNRDLGSMCVQMGNGVNRALMEVMVRLNAEYSPAPVPPPLGGNFNFDDGADAQFALKRAILPNETPQSSRQQRPQPHQNFAANHTNQSTGIHNYISPTPMTRSRSKANQQMLEEQRSSHTAYSTSDHQPLAEDEPIVRFPSPPTPNNAAATNSPASTAISMIAVRSSNCAAAQSQSHHQPSQQFNEMLASASTSNMVPPPPPLQQIPQNVRSISKKGRRAMGRGGDAQNLTTMTIAKKRPMMAALCTHPHEHFINNTQVPVNILAKTKPWRPPGGGQVFPTCNSSSMTASKKQRDQPSTSNSAMNQRNIPPNKINQIGSGSSNISSQIGPPLFTSTPTKKRLFPTFQL